ncbi:TPA: hypothetical protein ACF3VE_002179 [Pseudomonas aeruginosa]
MNKANECTCPSGDGSLVHPCPAHPAVEQAGANVGHGHVFPRADGVKMRCGGPGLCSECTADASRARAALAQPSQSQYEASFEEWLANELEGEDGQPVPAAVCDIALARRAFNHWPKLEQPAKVGGVRFSAGVSSRLVVEAAQRLYEFESTPEKEAERIEQLQAFREQLDPLNLAPHAEAFNEAPAEVLKPEQAERPEVVGVRYEDGTILSAEDCGIALEVCARVQTPLMTVSQHERIVGELRADRDSWAEQAEQRLADWDEMRKERDAALARVEELERQEPVALANRGLHAFWVKWTEAAAGLYGPGIKLYAAPVAQAQQLNDLDKQCRDDVARALGLRPNQERGFAWSYLLASIKSCVKASEDSAQAQHSVPEGLAEFSQFLSAVMDAAGLVRYGRRSKELSEYLGAQCMKYRLSAPVAQAQHSVPEKVRTLLSRAQCEIEHLAECLENVCEDEEDFDVREDVADGRVVAADIAHMLAAAPDKEVPQAWLDVQAERRRQVEAEGYHGFRDSHYISYELSKAARAYIEVSWHALSGGLPCKKPESWPWMAGFKWSDGRTMLVKACALALAEIERLDRAAHGKEVGHE